MPVHNIPETYLCSALDSVLGQVYPYWELCATYDSSTQAHIGQVLKGYAERDSRIRLTFRKKNARTEALNVALDAAKGRFVGLMDCDSRLHPLALLLPAMAISAGNDIKLVYTDEDMIDRADKRFNPYFKPDWNPDLLLSCNYIGHLALYERQRLEDTGRFRSGFDGVQSYDMLLRFVEGNGLAPCDRLETSG